MMDIIQVELVSIRRISRTAYHTKSTDISWLVHTYSRRLFSVIRDKLRGNGIHQ